MDRLPLELLREICLRVEPPYRVAFRNINQYTRGAFEYHFRRPCFELGELETMHRNCGSIQTLTLQEARIAQVSQPHHITTYLPVELSNLTLSFHRQTGANAIGYMCQYVMKKYQSLQHIDFSEDWMRSRNASQIATVNSHGYQDFREFVVGIQSRAL